MAQRAEELLKRLKVSWLKMQFFLNTNGDAASESKEDEVQRQSYIYESNNGQLSKRQGLVLCILCSAVCRAVQSCLMQRRVSIIETGQRKGESASGGHLRGWFNVPGAEGTRQVRDWPGLGSAGSGHWGLAALESARHLQLGTG